MLAQEYGWTLDYIDRLRLSEIDRLGRAAAAVAERRSQNREV